MPGFLVHQDAKVLCKHNGTVELVAVNPRVKVSGKPIVIQKSMYNIKGCSLTSPTNPFCASVTWTGGATYVKAGRMPVVLEDSEAKCATTGTGLKIEDIQTRVKGK
jgi:hypothetical protein